jgi:hypothetical protein
MPLSAKIKLAKDQRDVQKLIHDLAYQQPIDKGYEIVNIKKENYEDNGYDYYIVITKFNKKLIEDKLSHVFNENEWKQFCDMLQHRDADLEEIFVSIKIQKELLKACSKNYNQDMKCEKTKFWDLEFEQFDNDNIYIKYYCGYGEDDMLSNGDDFEIDEPDYSQYGWDNGIPVTYKANRITNRLKTMARNKK